MTFDDEAERQRPRIERLTWVGDSIDDADREEEAIERGIEATLQRFERQREEQRQVNQMLRNMAVRIGREVDRHQPPPRYEPAPGYDDGRYLSQPTIENDKRQGPASDIGELQPPPAPRSESTASASGSLALPPAPRYTRSPSPTAGPSKSRWPKGSFSDGPIIALSLDDGGGDRTMMQLDMLETLMCEISRRLGYICPWGKGPNVLKPCDVFHLIVGSGTGGLIAILLGRLEMSVQAVKDFYEDNWEHIFGPLMGLEDVKTKVEPGLTDKIFGFGEDIGLLPRSARTIATEHLEEKIAWIVKIRNKGEELLHPKNPRLGKVITTAVHHSSGTSKTTILRSYPCPSDDGLRPSIIEAARAAMAHIAFFKPARIAGTPGEWTGSPAQYSNAIGLVLEEYPHFGSNDILVSVGAGIPDTDEQDSADKASHFEEDQPPKMSFADVMDWNARLCAKIERDKEHDRSMYNGTWLSASPRQSHHHFRLSRGSGINIAANAANVIKGIRRECIRREKERLRRDGAEQQSPGQTTPDGDSGDRM